MKRIFVFLIFAVFLVFSISLVSSTSWETGSLHQHTGYSTWWGYDGNAFTFGDDCQPRILEGPQNLLGYEVDELKDKALDENLDWLGFSDHSYCINSSEFNIVKSDCQNAQSGSFSCLSGEELSTQDSEGDDESFLVQFCENPSTGEAHIGGYGIDSFIPQSPEAVHCPTSPTAQNGINSINSQGISIINHPYNNYLLGGDFLDFDGIDSVSGETGIEIWNGEWASDDESGKNKWLNYLQQDKRIFAFGGTDSHAGPNRKNYNVVRVNSLDHANLEAGLRTGTSTVSNNGYVTIEAKTNTQGSWTQMGGQNDANKNDILTIRVTYSNIAETCTLKLLRSEIGSYTEHYYTYTLSGSSQFTVDYPLVDEGDYYFRAECIGSGGDDRTYTNPIWVDVLSQSCQCTDWTPGSCGGGTCDADQRSYTRSCTPDGCAAESECRYDPTCEDSGGGVNDCEEPGYEWCIESEYQSCTVSLAMNVYENVNNIEWGPVNDAWDPYVIGQYRIGWKGVDTEEQYYDVDDPNGEDCYYGGCDGEEIAEEGTRVTVTAPGTAHFEEVLGYDDNSDWACWVWFHSFNPNYGSDDPVYVLRCFDDGDCSGGQYCDKSGSWSQWSCVSKKSNGQSCSSDSQCQSGYCDNDGVGLSDDGWCFSPYNTYYDGQEPSYCEYSTNNGIVDCDERTSGTDLNQCVGLAYYEDECSSSCNYQDITSVFECTDSSCSCAQPLCDGLTTGSNITTCASGQTYLADQCTSTASGGDRSDNICRSSSFAPGCTADPECNNVVAGTGYCDPSCQYNSPPSILFVNPTPFNQENRSTNSFIINISSSDLQSDSHYALVDFDNDLNLWMRMDDIDGSGNPSDLSSHSNNGTKNGNASQISGYYGEAFAFDGDGDYINIPISQNLIPKEQLTIAGWIKPATNISGDNYRTIVGTFAEHQGGNKGGYGFRLISEGANLGKLEFFYWNGSSYRQLVSNSAVSLNSWNFVGSTYDGDNVSIYINGQEDNSYSAPEGLLTRENIYLGVLNFSTSGLVDYWNGSIDEMWVFNRSLDLQEIKSLYNASATQYQHEFTELEDGSYTLKGYAVDAVGNLNSTESRTVNIIDDIPTVSFVGQTPNNGSEQTSSSIFVNLSSSDSRGHYALVDFDNDLNLWMRMDDIDGSNNFVDLSSFSLNGSLKGNASISGAGKYGDGLILDANGDYVYISADDSVLPSDELTISAWVKPVSDVSGDNYRTILGTFAQHQGIDKGGYGFRMITQGANTSKLEFFYWNGSSYKTIVSNSTLPLGSWSLATTTYDGQTVKIYVNGQEDVSYSAPEGIISLDNLYIGVLNFSTTGLVDYWNGSIDEVSMFRRSLATNEIKSLYDSEVTQYYHNFTSLTNGVHVFTGYAVDNSGNKNQTEQRTVTLSTFLDLSNLSVVYTNNRQRVFRFVIANNYTSTISNISWILNNGQINQSSQYDMTLQSGENLFVYAHYNYTSAGNYTVVASAMSDEFSDSESVEIEVI